MYIYFKKFQNFGGPWSPHPYTCLCPLLILLRAWILDFNTSLPLGADKDNYINYHKKLIELVKVGGVIGYDNTLWNGSVVAPPDAPLRKYVRYYRDFVLELNKALAADPRIEICMLPVVMASLCAVGSNEGGPHQN